MSEPVYQLLESALYQPVAEFKCRQGKRIRGSLVQIGFEMAGGNGQVPAPIAESIECLHAGSLVIDDVQDESLQRRGEPTLHQVIGVPLAINAGNWMYFRALDLLLTASLPLIQRTRLVEAMVDAGCRCHEGQALDLSARVDRLPVSEWFETAQAISTLKTGALVELAVTMGCVAAGASGALQSALAMFGCQIGMTLQMRNDLDELSCIAHSRGELSAAESIRDDDLRHARVTWPWAWALELTGESTCRALASRLDACQRERQKVAVELLSIVQSHGDQVIANIIGEQLRLLGEHVIDRRLLQRMRDCLQPIERSRQVVGSEALAISEPASVEGCAMSPDRIPSNARPMRSQHASDH